MFIERQVSQLGTWCDIIRVSCRVFVKLVEMFDDANTLKKISSMYKWSYMSLWHENIQFKNKWFTQDHS